MAEKKKLEFSPDNVVALVPTVDGNTLIRYGDGKPSVIVTGSTAKVTAMITEAKARADSEE